MILESNEVKELKFIISNLLGDDYETLEMFESESHKNNWYKATLEVWLENNYLIEDYVESVFVEENIVRVATLEGNIISFSFERGFLLVAECNSKFDVTTRIL